MKFQPFTGKYATIARLAIYEPCPFIYAFEGAVASGKTIYTLLDWLRYVKASPTGKQHALVGRTERTVINNLIAPLQELFGLDRVQLRVGTGTAIIFGVTVNLVGANNQTSVTKIQGWTLQSAYVDEVANTPRNFFEMLETRMREPGARIWTTCNPDGPQHWWLKNYLEKASLHVRLDGTITRHPTGKDIHRYTLNLDDNPHLPPEFVERTKTSHTGVFYKRMVLCQWVAAEGAIYDSFDAEKHVVAGVPADAHGIADGIDAGTTNPSRGYALKLAPAPDGDGQALYLTREWAPPTGRTDGYYSQSYKDHRAADTTPGRFVYVDPAAKSLRVQMAQDGIRTVAPASNDVLAGIRTVASLFAAGRLYVTADCAELIRELEGYVWDSKATAAGLDKPLKVDDHAVDAMRYAIYSSRHLWQRHIPVNAAEPVTDDESDYAAA